MQAVLEFLFLLPLSFYILPSTAGYLLFTPNAIDCQPHLPVALDNPQPYSTTPEPSFNIQHASSPSWRRPPVLPPSHEDLQNSTGHCHILLPDRKPLTPSSYSLTLSIKKTKKCLSRSASPSPGRDRWPCRSAETRRDGTGMSNFLPPRYLVRYRNYMLTRLLRPPLSLHHCCR